MTPIIDEPNQPDDFIGLLDNIDFLLLRVNLTWNSDRVVQFIDRIHGMAGFKPATAEIARYALSYQQLQALKRKLEAVANTR